MSNNSLDPVQFAAALAEIVYHRASQDGPIKYSDLGATVASLNGVPAGLVTDPSAPEASYYSARGFVGQVVQKDGTLYVVLRGTDLSASFLDGFKAALSSNLDQTAPPDPKGQIDLGDVANDALLGNATAAQTQLDDALALTQAAKEFAAANGGLQVVVVGQSLGGGLAGLVSAIANVKGYAIDPAPFERQLQAWAFKLALERSTDIKFAGISVPALVSELMGLSEANQVDFLKGIGNSDSSVSSFLYLADAGRGQDGRAGAGNGGDGGDQDGDETDYRVRDVAVAEVQA